tara:strand:+ start:183308 stop:183676 length:369 start_codon:yes stop_codon:yes gene_type:complete
MYSDECITDFIARTQRAPKVYIEQRMSVNDNDDINYVVYTILKEGQGISREDADDLVIIPDTRETIIGDFNCKDKKLTIQTVAKEILVDQRLQDMVNLPILKTPVWKYTDHAAKLASPRSIN